jgi:hypothetical protein
MGIIQGSGSKLQLGLESTWGTKVTPTVNIGYTSESMKFIPNYKQEDTLVGAKTTGRMDLFGKKVEGDINLIVHPDTIGWLLWEHFGAEGNATASGSAYTHAFTHVAAGASTSLPNFTMVIDRIVSAYAFVSCKSDQMKLSAKVNDYLRATFTLRGYSEASSAIVTLTDSTTKGIKFSHGAVTVAGSAYAEITSFDLADNNNLENDLYVMNGSSYMIEIEPGERQTTGQMEVLYSSTTEGTRSAYFVTGTPCSVVVTFTSDEMAGGTDAYKLTITMPNCYITDASPNVGGPERLKQSLSFTAAYLSSTEAITVTVQDARSTKYSA